MNTGTINNNFTKAEIRQGYKIYYSDGTYKYIPLKTVPINLNGLGKNPLDVSVPPMEDYTGGKYPTLYIDNQKGAPGDFALWFQDNWYWVAGAGLLLIILWSFRK